MLKNMVMDTKYSISKKINDFTKGKELLINAQKEENELLQYLLSVAKSWVKKGIYD